MLILPHLFAGFNALNEDSFLLLPYVKKIPDTYMYIYYYASLSLGLCNNSANRHVRIFSYLHTFFNLYLRNN